MTQPDAEELYRESVRGALASLAIRCCTRFARAADLVQLRDAEIAKLRRMGHSEPIGTTLLYPAWRRLCARFLDERYDAQLALFGKNLAEHRAERFREFVYWELFPVLEEENELVRNVLRAVGGLPCTSKQDAADAVLQYFEEMTLPSARPRWTQEESPE